MKILNYNEFLNQFKYANEMKELINEYVVYSCLAIANNAKFPTDYIDVKEHLFESDDYIRLFIIDEDGKVPQIKGFLISALENGYNDNVILHCHGIIIDPSIQGKGYSKKMDDYYLYSGVFLFHPKPKIKKTENSVKIYATLVKNYE